MTTAVLVTLGTCAAIKAQETPPAQPATETRREQRVENRDARQDQRQDQRQEGRDDRQDLRQARQQDPVRQENRQERREQIRERLLSNEDGRRPIDTIFTLVDRIVDVTASPDVANASLPQV